ncbi:hypothetical protein [Sphingomonas montanisoli]|uniref:Uncharacterized protein n=1 Tax=Sphingomonas montanisoli TaxID=2606412 RepID=A0A5D9C7X7_9SPHN|nr:hypothetical protein [Sphingomonas montanisoli]TZG26111.1 hypothetical protein FYJ91_14215 [Sphingomonas montanisoli]
MSFLSKIEIAPVQADDAAPRHDALFDTLSVLSDIGRVTGGQAATQPNRSRPHEIAARYHAAGSLTRVTVMRIAGDAERMAAAGLRAVLADRAGTPSTAAAARLLADSIGAAFSRIDALLPQAELS